MSSNRYLEKIADKQRKDPVFSGVKAGLGTAAIGQIAVLGGMGHQAHLGNFSEKAKYSKEELASLRSYLRKNKLRNVKFEKNLTRHGPHFRLDDGFSMGQTKKPYTGNWNRLKTKFKRPVVNNPIRNYNVLMHELGHAKDYANKSPLRTRIAEGTATVTRFSAVPVGVAAGAMALGNEKTEKYAPTIAALSALPVMHSELSADRHAFKHILKTMGKKRALKFAGGQIIPLTSYATTLGAPAVGTYFARKAIRENRKNHVE